MRAGGWFDRAAASASPSFFFFFFTGIFRWIRRRWTGRTVRTVPAGRARARMHARVGAPRTRLARAHTYRMLLLLLPID